ncbi:MAG: sigma-70 family RNA polymerase sigma factor [Luteimonas sp.]|nr:sigma-70 family RNA polymerase sigma factor [Luteimonas sp.]
MTEASVLDREGLTEQVDALLKQVAGGDRKAFDALYRATSSALMGVCMRVLADRTEAEEVLQDVFVTVWGKAAQFDRQRSRAMTWLGSIARNRAIDRLRGLPATAPRAGSELIDLAQDPAPSPAAQAESAGERVRLDECLEQLEPQRRSLIRTAFFEGATYEELAVRSGSPLGSVKSWIRRSLLQLRTCLER